MGVYTDGVQDGYPSVGRQAHRPRQRRDVLGPVRQGQVSAGVFDGAIGDGQQTNVLSAGRVQVDFWDPEGGYYLNGTYYGGKNLLAIGVARARCQDGNTACNGDFLLEKKVPGAAVSRSRAKWRSTSKLGGYDGRYGKDTGGYVLGSYLFPPLMGRRASSRCSASSRRPSSPRA